MSEGTVVEYSARIIRSGQMPASPEIVLEIAPGNTMVLACTQESAKWAGAHLYEYVNVRVEIGDAR